MANVQHNSLTTTDLHENKGVSSASNNTVATASAGATVWKLLDSTNLSATGNPFANFALFQEQQASGVASSTSPGTKPTFTTVVLNTTVTSQSWASLSGNQITLSSGTYVVIASLPSSSTKLKIRNVTGSSDIIIGQNASGTTKLFGSFVLGGSTNIALQATGGAVIGSVGASVTEIYGEVILWKIA